MLHILCGALTVGGYVTILSSLITLIIALCGKNKKSEIKGPIIAFAVGAFMVLLSSLILNCF